MILNMMWEVCFVDKGKDRDVDTLPPDIAQEYSQLQRYSAKA